MFPFGSGQSVIIRDIRFRVNMFWQSLGLVCRPAAGGATIRVVVMINLSILTLPGGFFSFSRQANHVDSPPSELTMDASMALVSVGHSLFFTSAHANMKKKMKIYFSESSEFFVQSFQKRNSGR